MHDRATYDENIKSISSTISILTLAYVAFLLPLTTFETCSPAGGTFQDQTTRKIIASWWVFQMYIQRQNTIMSFSGIGGFMELTS